MHDKAERFAYHIMKGDRFEGILEARQYMALQWQERDTSIPQWVDTAALQLDLAYTTPEAAQTCVEDLMRTVPSDVTFIEPSAGAGAFVDALPPGTIAMDVLPRHGAVQQGEFLSWEPPGPGSYCVVGAPPFGVKLWLTNMFVMHALDMAKWVGFIVDARALREMPNGAIHHVVPLGSDSMRGLSGGRVRRSLEWRVWCGLRSTSEPI